MSKETAGAVQTAVEQAKLSNYCSGGGFDRETVDCSTAELKQAILGRRQFDSCDIRIHGDNIHNMYRTYIRDKLVGKIES
ncbi:hypothetical protein TWF970_001103 [Orbilia oligospora]|uniref:Uncharacterized protein n=1 Tax=Orbilia oligospora TaxID=2813651 RepID=A0A7C8RBF2_ORBOL|nr:hypothetical protein TWF970_001103 [Orbilia oligospora]